MKIIRFIYFLFLGNFAVFSQVIEIRQETSKVSSIEELSNYYIDTTNRLTLQEVKEIETFLPFENNARIVLSNTTFWLKINVENSKKESIHWVMNFYDPDFSLIEFHDDNIIYTSGVDLPFTSKRFYHKNFIFPVYLEADQEKTYWIKMQSDSRSSIKADLTNMESHQAYALSEYYLLGLYYGILFILSVYNLILFIHTKNKAYIYYVIYLISAIIFSFNEDGLGFQFLWKEYPSFNHFINFSSPFFLLFSFLVFATSFLDVNEKSKQFRTLMALGILALISSLLYFIHWLPISMGFIFYLLPFVYLFHLALQKARKKKLDAIYFLIGNSLILGSLIIYYLRLNNWVYSGVFEVYAFNFSVVLEAIVLSMAVGDKIRLGIKKQHLTQEELILSLREKELLSTKVNRELEQKVKTRTRKLEDQKQILESNNKELLELKGKLYEMNEALDLANFRLKKEVDQYSKSQILNKEVTYEKFMHLYGEKHLCLNYLRELKETKGFECKKCKSIEFKLKDSHSRQCKVCKQIESATAHTIFHSIKFDLSKAFYLVYLTHYDRSKFTIDGLSETLNLGRNTCWNFIKKIENKKNSLSKEYQNNQISFDDIIL